MTDRPILFSAPMVRALLDGRKTQTRRVLKGAWQAALEGHDRVKTWFAPPDVPREGIPNQWAQSGIWAEKHGPRGYNRHLGFAPYRPGDRLWVRETWKPHSSWATTKPSEIPVSNIFYRADDKYAPSNTPWRVAIHMPRWASRLTLTVAEVRVQRLQDISEADARAEGMPINHNGEHYDAPPPDVDQWQGYGRASFSLIWSELHGKESWDANPLVVALTFTVAQRNIDAP